MLLARENGFCFGVKKAVELTEAAAETGKPVYNLGQVVHNPKISERLGALGVKVIKDPADAKEGIVVIRAHGVPPETRDLEDLLQSVPRFAALEFRGLMTVPPFSDDAQGARPYFRRLRELRDSIARRKLPGISMEVLSMGMSHDFEVAIEEGSTCVRVGTAIFGERPKP